MKRILGLAAGMVAMAAGAGDRAAIEIDAAKPGAPVAPSLYGIFYEEINHAGDGGLYAEMIRNRSFEETLPIEGCALAGGRCVAPDLPHYQGPGAKKRRPDGKPWSEAWSFESPWPAWTLETSGGANATMTLETNGTVHPRNPVFLRVKTGAIPAGGTVRLANAGYWGVSVKRGETYDGSFFARVAGGAGGAVKAGVAGADGRDLGSASVAGVTSGDWKKFAFSFPGLGSDAKARFVLDLPADTILDLDVVSLFPRATFKGRPGGLRADIAQLLADLKPAFVRFPGGCVVEGATFANRYRWKETIGPVEGRPGHWSLWGYRNIDGLGYHEFLQLCEDLGAEGMYVCNVGLACEFRNGDFLPEERLDEQLQDTLDAVEYALGGTDTRWGAERAKNGHPAPFPLTMVEIGNENHGPVYNRYYNKFHAALKAKWPKLVLIFNGGTSDIGPGREVTEVRMLDEHYYRDADWFFANATRYDDVPRDRGYDLYVGEFACNRGVGSGNLRAALSEAAFMAGMERNGDLVKLCSYAPLFFHVNDIKWPVNMIGFDNTTSFGRTSYHGQKLFASNRPDVNLRTAVRYEPEAALASAPFGGRAGVGAWDTAVEYSDAVLVDAAGKATALDAAAWTAVEGSWKAEGGALRLDEPGAWKRGLFAPAATPERYTVRLKARRNGGREGFLVLFGAKDGDNYRQLNLGGWGNTAHGFEAIVAKKQSALGGRANGSIETGRWYDIEVRIDGPRVEAWLDGAKVLETGAPLQRFQAIAGLDRAANEIVVKIVNGEERPVAASITIRGAAPKAAGRRIEMAGRLEEENTLAEPAKIVPVESPLPGVAPSFPVDLKPASLTVLRLPLAR